MNEMNDHFEFISSVAGVVFDIYAEVDFNNLTIPEQNFVCVWTAQGEIDNG